MRECAVTGGVSESEERVGGEKRERTEGKYFFTCLRTSVKDKLIRSSHSLKSCGEQMSA